MKIAFMIVGILIFCANLVLAYCACVAAGRAEEAERNVLEMLENRREEM